MRIAGGRPLRAWCGPRGTSRSRTGPCCSAPWPRGATTVRGLSDGDDVARTAAAVEALGAVGHAPRPTRSASTGGRLRPRRPARSTAGTRAPRMRLLAGVVAGLGRAHRAGGGRVARRSRPMDRVAEPLRAMGATVEGRGERCLPPLVVEGGPLHGIEWAPPVASAQVKSACCWPACRPTGETVVREAVATRAHTEEMLAEAGADITVAAEGAGRVVRLRPSVLPPAGRRRPGRPLAGRLLGGGRLPGARAARSRWPGSTRGPSGRLRRCAAPDGGPAWRLVGGRGRRPTSWPGPGRCTAPRWRRPRSPPSTRCRCWPWRPPRPRGPRSSRDVGELRVKESDRLAAVAQLVAGPGGRGRGPTATTWWSTGSGRAGGLRHARIDSGGDHRMAMAAAVAALAAGLGGQVEGFGAVATSYPGFLADLRALGGSGQRLAGRIVAIDGPAGSGKSTVSRAVAERLGLERLDTGAMYRAVAWAVGRARRRRLDAEAVAAVAAGGTDRDRRRPGSGSTGPTSPTPSAPPRSSAAVSAVAANPEVRRHLVERQRRWAAEHGGGVVEGRDIGTVVFPDADLKVYLTATPEERARRRHEEPAEGLARRDRDRLDPGRLAAHPGRGRPPARHHRAQRRGCGRGGALVAVDAPGHGAHFEPDPGARRPSATGVCRVDLRGDRGRSSVPPPGSDPGGPNVPDRGAGRPGPGPPVLRRLRVLRLRHRPQALLHGQGRAVEAPAAGPAPARPRGLPGSPRVGRPLGPAPRRGGPAPGAGAGDVPRGHPPGGRARRRSAGGGGLPGGPDRGGARPGRHRQLRPGHAQGAPHPQAPEDPGGGGRAHATPPSAARAGGWPAAGSTPPPPSSAERIQHVYDQARR